MLWSLEDHKWWYVHHYVSSSTGGQYVIYAPFSGIQSWLIMRCQQSSFKCSEWYVPTHAMASTEPLPSLSCTRWMDTDLHPDSGVSNVAKWTCLAWLRAVLAAIDTTDILWRLLYPCSSPHEKGYGRSTESSVDDLTVYTITVYTDNLEPCQHQLHYLNDCLWRSTWISYWNSPPATGTAHPV